MLAGRGVEEGADGEDLAHLGQLVVDFVLLPVELVEFALSAARRLCVGLDVSQGLLAVVLGLGDDQLGLAVGVGDLFAGVLLRVAPGLLGPLDRVDGALLGVGRAPIGLLDQVAGGLLAVGQALDLQPFRLLAAGGELDLEVGFGLGPERLGLLQQELLASSDVVGLAAGGADDVVALPLAGRLDLGQLPFGVGPGAGLLELGGGAEPGGVGLGGGFDRGRLAFGLGGGGLDVVGDLPLGVDEELLDAGGGARVQGGGWFMARLGGAGAWPCWPRASWSGDLVAGVLLAARILIDGGCPAAGGGHAAVAGPAGGGGPAPCLGAWRVAGPAAGAAQAAARGGSGARNRAAACYSLPSQIVPAVAGGHGGDLPL